ncbi:MAG: YigZ family protein [Bacteroidales bacterium]|nr:YigZ family protein [Bacteroidales bacterium]
MSNSTDTYLTIAGESQGIYREKASKFIGLAFPVNHETDIKEILARLRKEYYDANHHCYAYCLGYGKNIYRINDDGEPSGSAGKPIYGQILSHDISDILIVVIRYFGGTKLGIPGLIHSYRTAAKEAIEHACIVEKTLMVKIQICFGYLAMNEVMHIIKEEECQIINRQSDESCTLEVMVRKSSVIRFQTRIQRLKDISKFVLL